MSKIPTEAVKPPETFTPKPILAKDLLPVPVWISAAILIVVGVLIYATRTARLESTTYAAISECDAATKKTNPDGKAALDGLSEEFGLVAAKQNESDVTQYFSLCGMDPKTALAVFRHALNDGNSSAKIIALYSSIFLAEHLDADDFKLMLKCLEEKDKAVDVSRVAQRAVSDLTLLKRVDNVAGYEALPPMPPVDKDKDKSAPERKIKTRKETMDGQGYLEIRWSDPELALAWWKANATNGVWDAQLHRFVVP